MTTILGSLAAVAWAAFGQVATGPGGPVGDRYGQPSSVLSEAAAAFQDPPAAPGEPSAAPAGVGAAVDFVPSYRQAVPPSEPELATPLQPASPGAAPYTPTPAVPATALPSGAIGLAPSASTAEVKPAQVLRPLVQPPSSGGLSGTSLTLAEAMRGAASRREQTDRARAYWELAVSTAHYYDAERDDATLRQLAAQLPAPGDNWLAALAAQQSRVRAARVAAEAAQGNLQRMLGPNGPSTPALAADMPLAGRYETRYAEIFGSRPDRAAQQLHELLPLTYAALAEQAGAIARSTADWERVAARGASLEADGVLASFELLALRRRDFLNTVREYNLQIAEYTQLATPELVASDRLVAMLISSRKLAAPPQSVVAPASAVSPSSAVTPASAVAPVRPTAFIAPQASAGLAAGSAPPDELAAVRSAEGAVVRPAEGAAVARPNGNFREVRRPILRGFRDREHSILVRPLVRLFGRD